MGKTTCTRTQIPLSLAWSLTIHKAQGMSIGPKHPIKCVEIDLGAKEFELGLTFVALSRAASLACVMLLPCPGLKRRLQRLSKHPDLPRRKAEEQRAHQMAEQLFQARQFIPLYEQ